MFPTAAAPTTAKPSTTTVTQLTSGRRYLIGLRGESAAGADPGGLMVPFAAGAAGGAASSSGFSSWPGGRKGSPRREDGAGIARFIGRCALLLDGGGADEVPHHPLERI